MNKERGKASFPVHTYGTEFEWPESGVGSGRFNDPDSRASFMGLWDQLPPLEFLPFIFTSAKKELILCPNHSHQDDTFTPFTVSVMRSRVLWLL